MSKRILLSGAFILAALSPAHAGNWTTFAGSAQRLAMVSDETALTPASVGGLKVHWSTKLQAASVTQPLYMQAVTTPNGTHDEIFVGTTNGFVDAVNAITGVIDWSVSLPTFTPTCDPGALTKGVSGTPTIDPAKNLMYVVDGTGWLHALDIGTGVEAQSYPIQVIDTVNRDAGSFNHSSPTLVGHQLFITTSGAGACEATGANYHGSVIAFDTTLNVVTSTFFSVGNGTVSGGGIWGPGGVLAESDGTSIYTATGNALGAVASVPFAETVLQLDPATLNVLASNTPRPGMHNDLDFGSTPTPIDVAGCLPMMAVMNKTGALYIYQRANIAAGPVQVLQMSAGGNSSSFIGMTAFDAAVGMLFVDNPVPSKDAAFIHGLIALKVTTGCTLQVAYQSSLGSGLNTIHTRSRDPVIAGGIVWIVTGAGKSVLAFDETAGTMLWSSGTTMTNSIQSPVVVENGQMITQSGGRLYAWGL